MTSCNSNFKPHFFPDFDPLRWLAFLMVFFQHSFFSVNPSIQHSNWYIWFVGIKNYGHLGIDLFFVLSGFLISYKILEERSITNKFSLKNFLIRRCLRIWPLYFLIVSVGFGVIPAISFFSDKQVSLPDFWFYITFTANYYIRFNDNQFIFLLVLLWSISVEEQFYLFWSVILKFLNKWFLHFCFLATLLSTSYYFWALSNNSHNLYFDTLIYIPDFTAGALFAIIAIRKNKLFRQIQELTTFYILAVYALLIGLIITLYSNGLNHYFDPFKKCMVALLFGFLIFEQSFCNNSIFKFRSLKKSNHLGKISYGLYCYHGVVISMVAILINSMWSIRSPFVELLLIPGVILFITIILSSISYAFFEKPFLVLKNRFNPI